MPKPPKNFNFKDLANKWDLKGSLIKARDTRNFTIEKPGRFGARFFQIFCALGAWYFLAQQDDALITAQGGHLRQTIKAIFFAIVSPIISGLLIAVYLLPVFLKKWTSRRILIIETACDFIITLCWFAGFIASLSQMKGECPPAKSPECDRFNWAVAWFFFSFAFFAAGLTFDVRTWYKAVFEPQEVDAEVLLDIRRTTRGRY
ncbi:hypothetical protein HK097_001489 [Rhizophlyctis rosea]|uniref:MARVEL domain-containing protein n=1 Tax=Rhizophlyctis rosea TaxID=64517 RepID=A0AAD5SKY9_9FUNG|nr:hypothetical protein HK097_001489 [Rhizophlyctis rosea]